MDLSHQKWTNPTKQQNKKKNQQPLYGGDAASIDWYLRQAFGKDLGKIIKGGRINGEKESGGGSAWD